MEFHKELLHVIIDSFHLVITHHPDHVNPKPPNKKRSEIQKNITLIEIWKRKKIRKDYRQLHEIHVSALGWGRHCCLCLCLCWLSHTVYSVKG